MSESLHPQEQQPATPALDTETLAAWNIKAGGFTSYQAVETVPEREEAISDAVIELRSYYDVSTLSLTDAHHWGKVYGSDQGIADHLGFQEARFTHIDDARLNENDGAGIGLAVATDRQITRSGDLDLGTRQGLGVILNIGAYGLQLADVYLDDLSEQVRARQVRALFSELEPDMPTIINGDFNALRRDLENASLNTKVRDMMVRALALALPKSTELGVTIKGMNERTVIPMIEAAGWRDADRAQCRPTAKTPRPLLFGIDYAFHNRAVAVSGFRVPDTGKASDHRPIVYTAQVAS